MSEFVAISSFNAQTNLATIKLFIADVRLPKTSRKALSQPWAGSRETSVSKVAVGLPDDTSPWVGRTQLTTTFFRRQLTVSGQVSRSHAEQRTVDPICKSMTTAGYLRRRR